MTQAKTLPLSLYVRSIERRLPKLKLAAADFDQSRDAHDLTRALFSARFINARLQEIIGQLVDARHERKKPSARRRRIKTKA